MPCAAAPKTGYGPPRGAAGEANRLRRGSDEGSARAEGPEEAGS